MCQNNLPRKQIFLQFLVVLKTLGKFISKVLLPPSVLLILFKSLPEKTVLLLIGQLEIRAIQAYGYTDRNLVKACFGFSSMQ